MRAFLLIILCFPILSFCQDEQIVLKGFVNEDFFQLRWAPTSSDYLILGLQNGYQVTQSNGDEKKVLIIDPFIKRREIIEKNASKKLLDIIDFTAGFLETNNESARKQGFAMLTLAASTDKRIAEVLGVYMEDSNLSSSSYVYSVAINDSEIKSNELKLSSKKKSKNPECSTLIGSSRVDLKEVYLNWEAKELNDFYGGYWILKSTDNKTFNKLNENPLFHFTSQYEPDKTAINFVDTAVTEGSTYFYKVQPINHFGDFGIQSNTVEVYVQRRLEGQCLIDSVESKELTRIISGHYSGKSSEIVDKFVLLRADKIDSTYTLLETQRAENSQFRFSIDTDVKSGDRHYFKVAAISEDLDTAYSYPYYYFTLDQEPPGTPTELMGKIDSLGIVTLTWKSPEDNDIQGYRVFRMNSLIEEPVEITQRLRKPENFYDTLRLDNLTSEIFYTVRAIDNNYNNGPNSEVLELQKPDTIAPVPAAFKHYRVTENGVHLKWANSPSTDLLHQYLVRQYEFFQDTILSFYNEHDTILDSEGQLGIRYEYFLIAEDKSGNASKSQSLAITYEIGYRPAPEIIDIRTIQDEHKIILNWKKVTQPVYSIQIYRAKNDGKYRLYKTLRENVSQFEDTDLSINNEYHYKIKVSYKGGISSKMSEPVKVLY